MYPSSLFITLHPQSQNVNPTQHLTFFHWWTNPTTTDIPLIPIDPSHKKGTMSTLAIIFLVFLVFLIVILAILIIFLYLLKKKLNGGATGPPPPLGVRRRQKYWTLHSAMSKVRSWRWRWLEPLRLREFRRLCSSFFFLVSSVCNVRGLVVLSICVWLCNGCPKYIYIYIYGFWIAKQVNEKIIFKKNDLFIF